jgi:hypothetical protein
MTSLLAAKSDEPGSIVECSGMASGGFFGSSWCAAIDAFQHGSWCHCGAG